jgi:ferrochelatase
MAEGCDYQAQLLETCGLVASGAGHDKWKLVFQSRSGPPTHPWLEPDISTYLSELKETGATDVVVAPIGFVSDHMEVLYDLDTVARTHAEKMGLNMIRAATVGTHPLFVSMIRELIVERIEQVADRPYFGTQGPSHDTCLIGCCAYDVRQK